MIEETVIRFNSNVASLEAVPTSEKMMSSSRVSRQEADLFAHSRLYMVELARGSSHIASTLTQSSQTAAIEEVLANFRDVYGVTNLRLFIELLARAL